MVVRFALFTNIPSPHQIPLGEALAERLGKNFTLVCWEEGLDDRNKLGWTSNYEFEWLLVVGDSEAKRNQALEILRSADVVIWGYAPSDEILQRLRAKKLTFRYTERPFKRGRWRLLDPRVLLSLRLTKRLDLPFHHLLAVGPYCVDDFHFTGMFQDRKWRWGYFPELPSLETERELNSVPIILWAGRMLDWKQVDLLLEAAKWLRERGAPEFRVKLIGYGPEENHLRALAARYGLTDIVTFHEPQESARIIEAMKEADIYVFPSSKVEGWGVVVNEAMSCECCVIGSKLAGSVPWLIRDGVNGFQFDGKTVQSLAEKLLYCLNHPEQRLTIGRAARATITNLWSPAVVADRLIALCNALTQRKTPVFSDEGPCSKV